MKKKMFNLPLYKVYLMYRIRLSRKKKFSFSDTQLDILITYMQLISTEKK